MWKFIITVVVIIVLAGCQNTPIHSSGSKGAPMSFHQPKGGDGLSEVYQSVRTIFIVITGLAFLVDTGIVIHQLVVYGEAKKGLLALLALLFVLNAILLIFK